MAYNNQFAIFNLDGLDSREYILSELEYEFLPVSLLSTDPSRQSLWFPASICWSGSAGCRVYSKQEDFRQIEVPGSRSMLQFSTLQSIVRDVQGRYSPLANVSGSVSATLTDLHSSSIYCKEVSTCIYIMLKLYDISIINHKLLYETQN
jgi:hypothetical protein